MVSKLKDNHDSLVLTLGKSELRLAWNRYSDSASGKTKDDEAVRMDLNLWSKQAPRSEESDGHSSAIRATGDEVKIKMPYPSTESIDVPQDVVALLKNAYPDYRGRKFRLEVRERVRMNDTYWDGGSKSYYAVVRLSDGRVNILPDLISGGYAPTAAVAVDALRDVEIPVGFAIVRHSIFCGKDTGLTLILRPENMAALLPTRTA